MRDEIQLIIETGNEQTNDSIECTLQTFIIPFLHYSIPILIVAEAVCLINSSLHGIDPFVTFVTLNNPILSMRSLAKERD